MGDEEGGVPAKQVEQWLGDRDSPEAEEVEGRSLEGFGLHLRPVTIPYFGFAS